MDFSAALMDEDAAAEKIPAPAITELRPQVGANPFDLAPVRARLKPYEAKVEGMRKQALAHKVSDDASYKAAVDMGGGAKSLYKAIEKQRKLLVADPGQYVSSVNGLCKVFKSKLEDLERALKKEMSVYSARIEMARRETEKKARQEAARIQEQINKEAAAKGVEAPQVAEPVMPPAPKVARSDSGAAAYTKKAWVFEITDAGEVPREYLVPDEKLIRERIKQGVRNIAGVKIFQEVQTNFRTA